MSKKHRKYTEEFKRETVALMENSDRPIAEISRNLDIHESVLYRWRRKYGQQSPNGSGGEEASRDELVVEVKRLKREVEVLKQERDILKKAISIFSQERR